LTVDLTGLDYLDSSGALALLHLKHEAEARSVPFEFIRMNSRVKGIMYLLHTVTFGAA
jgi:anti-anti-sigma regulatory factor